MSPIPLPPDPWVAVLLRRLLLVSLAILALARFTPRAAPRPADSAPNRIPAARVLPTVPAPLLPPGDGTLLPPFDVDDVEHSRAGWALLDRGEGEVLVLDPAGREVRRFGRRGAGPGELERPLDIGIDDEGTVAVLDASGLRLDLFPATGVPRRIRLPADGCAGTFGDDVVSHAGAWWVVRRCFDGPNADLEVVRVPEVGEADRVVRRVLTRMNTDPHLVPVLVADRGRLFTGGNLDACLEAVATTGPPLCLPRPPRAPIPDSTATRLFGDLGRRAASVGLDLEIPTHYPALIEARGRPGGPAVRAILPDGSAAWAVETRDTLWLLEPTGRERIEPGVDRWLMLRDDGPGLRVWVVGQGAPSTVGSS